MAAQGRMLSDIDFADVQRGGEPRPGNSLSTSRRKLQICSARPGLIYGRHAERKSGRPRDRDMNLLLFSITAT